MTAFDFLEFHREDYRYKKPLVRSFFVLPEGTSVPPKYPDKAPPSNIWDIFYDTWLAIKPVYKPLVDTVALVNREALHAVRTRRFKRVEFHPAFKFAGALKVFRPDTVLPYVQQIILDGSLDVRGDSPMDSDERDTWMEIGDFHTWMSAAIPLIELIRAHSPVDYLTLWSLSWPDVPIEIRKACRMLKGVRALKIFDVDFVNTNQYLMTLSSYPKLQYLTITHATWHALNHTPEQLRSREPLLLTELRTKCAYTGVLMEWLLGRREYLAIEELEVTSRERYRDDARLIRVIKKASPWLKRLRVSDSAGDVICEGEIFGVQKHNEHLWRAPGGVAEREEDIIAHMETYYQDDGEDVMDEDPNEIIGDDMDTDTDFKGQEGRPGFRTAVPRTPSPDLQEIHDTLLLPDDEGGICYQDMNADLNSSPFADRNDHGYPEVAGELSGRIRTPMLWDAEARIHWRSEYSMVIVKLFCSLTYDHPLFYKLRIKVSFHRQELFGRAPWKTIDLYLSNVLPELDWEDAEKDYDLCLDFAVDGWDESTSRAEAACIRKLKKKLPRTNRQGQFEIGVKNFEYYGPRVEQTLTEARVVPEWQRINVEDDVESDSDD